MGQARGRKTGAARLTHLDARGQARMVDVGAKPITERVAVASATMRMEPATLRRIQRGGIAKGEVLAVARIAGIMAAKRTADIVPLCHPLPVEVAAIEFAPGRGGRLHITATVRVSGKTGVEMEALTAVSVAALTIYDMCKAIDQTMSIGGIHLVSKTGGKSRSDR